MTRCAVLWALGVAAMLVTMPSLPQCTAAARPGKERHGGFLNEPAITNLDPVEAEEIPQPEGSSQRNSSESSDSATETKPQGESSWIDVFPDSPGPSENSGLREGSNRLNTSNTRPASNSDESSGLRDNNRRRRKHAHNARNPSRTRANPEIHSIFGSSLDAFAFASSVKNRVAGLSVADQIKFVNARDREGFTVLMRTAQIGDPDSIQRMEGLIDEYYPSILQTALKSKNATAYQMASAAGKTAYADSYLAKIREKTVDPSDSEGELVLSGASLSASIPTVSLRVCRFINTPLALEDSEAINSDLQSGRARSELVVSVTGVKLAVITLDADRLIFDEWWSSVMPMQPSLANASDPLFRDPGTLAIQVSNQVFVLDMKSSCAPSTGVPLAARTIIAITKTTNQIAAAMDSASSPHKTVSISYSSDVKHSFESVRFSDAVSGARVFPLHGLRAATKNMTSASSPTSSFKIVCVESDELRSGAVIAVSGADTLKVPRKAEQRKALSQFHADTLQYQVELGEDPFLADRPRDAPTIGDTPRADNPPVSGEPNILGESVFLRMDGKQITFQLAKGPSGTVPDLWSIPLQQLAFHNTADGATNGSSALSSTGRSSGLLFLYHTLSIDQVSTLAAAKLKSGSFEQSPALRWLLPLSSVGVDNPLHALRGPNLDLKWVLSTEDASVIATVIRKDIRAAVDDMSRLKQDVFSSSSVSSPFAVDSSHCSALSPRRAWCVAVGCTFCSGTCRAKASAACSPMTTGHDDFEASPFQPRTEDALMDAVWAVFGKQDVLSTCARSKEARAARRQCRRRALVSLQSTQRIRIRARK